MDRGEKEFLSNFNLAEQTPKQDHKKLKIAG